MNKFADEKNNIFLKHLRKTSLLLLFALFVHYSFAQTKDWTGGAGNSNWSDPGNWTPSGVPGASDGVFIPDGAHTIIVDADAECAALTFYPTSQGRTLTVNSGVTLKISGTGGLTLQAPSSSGILTSVNVEGTLEVKGNIAVNGTTSESRISLSGASTLSIGGDFSGTGELQLSGGNTTVIWAGDNTHMKSMNYDNLILRLPNLGSNRVKTMTADMTVSKNLTVESLSASSSITLNPDVYNLTVLGTTTIKNKGVFSDSDVAGNNIFKGDVTIEPNGSFLASGFAAGNFQMESSLLIEALANFDLNGNTLAIKGNWTNNGTFTANAGKVVFQGTAAQTIAGTTASSFENLEIANSAGVTLGKEINVAGVFTLSSGILTLGANNITLGASATVAGAPFSNSTMVDASGDGFFRKQSPAGFTFPIGDGTFYTPAEVTGGGGAGITSFRVKDAKHPNNNSAQDFLSRYWVLETSVNVNVKFTYDASDVVGDATHIEGASWSAGWVKETLLGGGTFTMSGLGNCHISGVDAVQPTISNVHIESNNAHNDAAKVGDVVSLTFDANEELSDVVVTIAGHPASVSNSGLHYTATYTMTAGDAEGVIPFNITFKDKFGNSGSNSPKNVTDDGSTVTFDKTRPTSQNTVFSGNQTVASGDNVTISGGSLPGTDEVWFAPPGTTSFAPGGTMSMATGSPGSISAPGTDGVYRLYVIDYAGNVSEASTSILFVGDGIVVRDDYFTIQLAIDNAPNNAIISVKPGTYYENIDFKGKSLCIRSFTGNQDVIIDGSKNQDAVVTMKDINGTPMLLNLTIRNGSGNLGSISGPHAPYGRYGGGIFVKKVHELTIDHCIIENNVALRHENTGGSGGGIYCTESTLKLTNGTIIKNNQAIVYRGGGLCADNSTVNIDNTNISDNNGGNYGGGIACWKTTINIGASVNINTNKVNGKNASGGGIFNLYSKLQGIAPTFSGNTSTRFGNIDYKFDESGLSYH